MHGGALLGAVLGVGGDGGAVTRPLRNTRTHLQQAQAVVVLPVHHVVAGLRGQRSKVTPRRAADTVPAGARALPGRLRRG